MLIILLCPQCQPRSEPLDTQCTEPQELSEYQKAQAVKEEYPLEIVPSSPEDKQSLMEFKINKEDDIAHFPHNLLTDATVPKDFGEDVSALAPSHIPRNKNVNVNESLETEVVKETLMSEQLMGQVNEDSVVKDKISDQANKMEEIVTGTPGELCDGSFSALKPADNPLLSNGETEKKMTKSHQQIIEKIRHYYEAAEAVAEEGQVSRRNSFSNIPAGLVKDSVSRFNFFVHQVSVCDSESGRSDSIENEVMPISPTVPERFSQPDCTSTDAEVAHNNQGKSNTESNSDYGEQICDFKPCMDLWKEKERKVSGIQENSKVYEGRFSEDKEVHEKDTFPTTDRKTPVLNEQRAHKQDHKECVEPKSPEQRDKTIKEVQSVVVTRDMTQDPKGSLDGLPSQIKVGRFSRHGKAVSCSRTLYEGIADVSSLEFFETAPMDQCLVENSEKILSKVQMLAQMYMAKSSSMKVPLHQKRTRFTQGPCKVNTPPKSQILLHQAEVKTQNQISGET